MNHLIAKFNPLFFIGGLFANQIAYTTFEIKWIYYESTFWIHNILVLLSFVFMLIGIYGWILAMGEDDSHTANNRK